MRLWVRATGGRAQGRPVPTAEKLWDELDWYLRRWGSRMKRRPALTVYVTSDTGESLLYYVRPGKCTRHSWRRSHDHDKMDVCDHCRKLRKTPAKELRRRERVRREVERLATQAFAGFVRNVMEAEGDR